MRIKDAIIIVPASDKAACNNFSKLVDPSGGGNTFVNALVPKDGASDAEPTHYWTRWQLTQEEWDSLKGVLDTARFKWFDGNEVKFYEAIDSLGLKRRSEEKGKV